MKKTKLITLITFAISMTSCYSVKQAVEESYPESKEISWPEDYKPEESKFFVHNVIEIDASPERVWEILINASEWESYYEGASNLEILDNSSGKLEENSVFTWKTMGLNFTSTIEEFNPPYRLSWESEKNSIRGYHAWLLIPTDNGTKLITSEAQHGFMTFLQKIFVPNKLSKLHDIWLAEIKKIAEGE